MFRATNSYPWGTMVTTSKPNRDAVDKVLLWFLRLDHRERPNANDVITLGACAKNTFDEF